MGANPSFAWRSIWKSRDVLINGCRWKIGDGSKINIMSEPWLRGEDNNWMQAPQIHSMYELYVTDLLLQGVKRWDIQKIQSLFSASVAENIIKTPLFEEVKEDCLVWQLENNGNYTVKSGYKHYIKSGVIDQNYTLEGDWGSLWRIKAAPKTKHLMWRVCRGVLPSRTRLRERHVMCPSECPLCDGSEEDDWHIFFGCRESKSVWIEAELSGVIESRTQQANNNVKTLFFDICRNESPNVAGTVATIAWCIWNNHNNWVWNGLKDTAKSIAMSVAHMLQEWMTVNFVQQQQTPITMPISTDQRWQQPRLGWWKCNVDVSFFATSGHTRWS